MTDYFALENSLRSRAELTTIIDGLETFLFSSNDYPDILEMLDCARYAGSIVSDLHYPNLRPGIALCPHHIERFRFLPVLCRRHGAKFLFVEVRGPWRCLSCKQEHGLVLMQSDEMDSIASRKSGRPFPKLAPIFRTHSCKNCGAQLQGKFLFLEDEAVFTDIHTLFQYMEETHGEDFSWFELPNDGARLNAQAEREIKEGHPLYGKEIRAIAKNERNDDVLFAGADCWWIIHLTWSNCTDAHYPRFDMIRDLNELKAYFEYTIDE